MHRKRAGTLLWDVLVDFPALVRLVYRLLKDSRVSRLDKAILGGILVYVLNPMDLLPDAIPGLGQVDDMYLVALRTSVSSGRRLVAPSQSSRTR